MWRILLMGLIFSISHSALADSPEELAKKPPYERLLKGEDAKTATSLQKQIDAKIQDDRFDESLIRQCEELVALRRKVQGAHWETANQLAELDAARKLAARTPEQRVAWRKSQQGIRDAAALEAKGQFVTAQPLRLEYARQCEALFGAEHFFTASAVSNLAINLLSQGKYDAAQPLFEQALGTRRKLLGEEHPHTADGYNNLAHSLNSQGQHAQAEPLFQKALDLNRRVLGEDDVITAASYDNLASNLDDQKKYAGSGPLFQRALDIRRKVFGEEHPLTATTYLHLAINLNSQRKLADAQAHYQKALDLRRKLLGDEHPGTALCFNSLAMNLDAQGKHLEARPLHERFLEIHRKTLGEEHPHTALSYFNLASNLSDLGDHADAQTLYQKALEIRLKVYGEIHPSVADCYNNLAGNLDDQGKLAEAQPFYRKALDVRRSLFGATHPTTAASYNNLATNLKSQGKYAEAQPLLEQALEIWRAAYGEEHPTVATGYNNLAANLLRQKNYDQAERYARQALELRRKVLGTEHPATATSANVLGSCLSNQQKYVEAQPHYQRALEIRRQAYGEEHPQTAVSYNNVACNLLALKQPGEAQPIFQKALEVSRKVLGEEHPDTARNYQNLAFTLLAQGKSAEAEELLTPAAHSYEASRLFMAKDLERAALDRIDPRLLLAAIRAERDPEGAWSAVELTLARSLLDRQARGKENALTPAELADQERWRNELKNKQTSIVTLATKADKTQPEAEQFATLVRERQALEARLAALSVQKSQREVASLAAIQAALAPDAALILWLDLTADICDIHEHWGCIVRSTGQPKWTRLPGAGPDKKWQRADNELPANLREALAGNRTPGELASPAKALRAQRLDPLTPHLSGVKTLYVVPVNAMAGVPVEALSREYTISYVSSGTFLARSKDKSPAAGVGLLALGDPVFERRDKSAEGTRTVPVTLPPGGVLITQVAPNGAAAKARLQSGDVIVKYGGTEITSMKALDEAMEKAASAKEVPIRVWRESEQELFTRTVAPGKLGVALAKEPARDAIANRRKTDQMLLALRGGGWKELPGTRVELTRISRLFGEQANTLVDSAASEESLEALRKQGDLLKFRYLHFATHGEPNDVALMESALILAQDNLPKDTLPKVGEPYHNGRLSASEVLEYWQLDAELVALSACETALGRDGGGDGLLGFAQAFLTAGARSVCLSLWKVDDTATALLMQRFYQNLLGKRPGLDKPMGKAAALDEAKRWLRELSSDEALKLCADMTGGVTRGTRGKGEELKLVIPVADPKEPVAKDPKEKPFAHPRYWAAFILIGHPN